MSVLSVGCNYRIRIYGSEGRDRMERHICLSEKYVLFKLMNEFFNKHLKLVSVSNEIENIAGEAKS